MLACSSPWWLLGQGTGPAQDHPVSEGFLGVQALPTGSLLVHEEAYLRASVSPACERVLG